MLLNAKKPIALFSLLLSLMIFVPACKPDYKLLDGSWKVTSWKIDGEELLGSVDGFESAKIEFNSSDKNSGASTFTVTESGIALPLVGTYTLDSGDDKVTITIDGDTLTFDYEVSKNDLKLSGTSDGETYVIVAEAD